MEIANGIASAVDYLQSRHRIAVLNLNPDTIGFLQDGTVQLFDLGHCKEIPIPQQPKEKAKERDLDEPSQEEEVELTVDDLNVMFGSSTLFTADTNTIKAPDGPTQTGGHRKVLPTATLGIVPRYLAPEILTTGQFSLKSDSYSLAIVLHEMFTLSPPYEAYKPGQHMIKVCIQGKRPNLQLYQFPKTLENLLYRGWRHNWNKRISVCTMKKVLTNVKFTGSSNGSDGGRARAPPSTRGMPPTTSARLRRGRRPPSSNKNGTRRSFSFNKSLTSQPNPLKRNKSLIGRVSSFHKKNSVARRPTITSIRNTN